MKALAIALVIFSISGCASKKINYDKITPIEIKEFDKVVKIKVEEINDDPSVSQIKAAEPGTPLVPGKVTPPVKEKPKPIVPTAPVTKLPKLPKLEDSEGFSGRRPIIDPYVVGEKVVLDVKYMNMRAGTLTIATLPYAKVNNQKTYHFRINVKTSPSFEYFYAVDDMVETFVTYDSLVPLTHLVVIKESKQFGETRSYFDWSKKMAQRWETKFEEGKERVDKKKEWSIEAFSQNIVSSLFYLRTFTLTPGKTIAFRVADGGENYVFKGQVLRREVLDTVLGKINTVVVQPEVTIKGALKPMGDIFIWLTDDNQKQIVQIQSKIKIGSVFAKVVSM